MTKEDCETGEYLVSPYIEIWDREKERGAEINVHNFYSRRADANFQHKPLPEEFSKDLGKQYSVYHVISESSTLVGICAGHIARVHRGFVYEKYLKQCLPKTIEFLEMCSKRKPVE